MKKCIKKILPIFVASILNLNAQSLISLNSANFKSPDISFHNSAAIAWFENYHIMVSTQFLQTGLADESMQNSLLNFVYPLDNYSAFGARIQYFNSNVFQQGNFSLLYGQKFFNDIFTAGVNVNLLTYGYDKTNFFLFDFNDPLVEKGTSKSALSFGLSLLARPVNNLWIGFSADHLNSPDISLSGDAFKKEKVFTFGLAWLNNLVTPQWDMRIEGNETVTQLTASKLLYNSKINLKGGYNIYSNEGSSFFTELDFFIGDLGILYSYQNPLGALSEVSSGTHQIGLFYTKSKRASVPVINLSNVNYDSHLPELEILGIVTNPDGLGYIEIKNNNVVQERIECADNTLSENISKKIELTPGENNIEVTAYSSENSAKEHILVDFTPLPPVIEINSVQNIQVDKENYEFKADISDKVGLQNIHVFFNDQSIKTFSALKVKSEKINIPVKLKPGKNIFKVFANNKWMKTDDSSSVIYKSAELPPVLTIDSPQKPLSSSSSVIINLELENKTYIDKVILKVNGEQKEVITLKPKTRGIAKTESFIPVTFNSFTTGTISRPLELNASENIIEATAYDSTGLPRTSSDILKILYNPYEEQFSYHKKIAIIIGLDKYKSEKISKLDLAVSDAGTVRQLLNDYYHFDEVHTLYNNQATFSGITRVLFSTLKNAGPEDLVIVYYAGHGNTVDDQFGGESGYLLPYDTDLDADLNMLSMTTLNQKAIQSRAKDILFIIDACYSGLGLVTVPPLSQYPSEKIDFEKLNNDVGRISRNIIAAGGRKQEAVDGLFTRILKNGLMGAADYNHDNYITSGELGFYLKSNVAKEAKKYKLEQIPQFGSIIGDQGEMIFQKAK